MYQANWKQKVPAKGIKNCNAWNLAYNEDGFPHFPVEQFQYPTNVKAYN